MIDGFLTKNINFAPQQIQAQNGKSIHQTIPRPDAGQEDYVQPRIRLVGCLGHGEAHPRNVSRGHGGGVRPTAPSCRGHGAAARQSGGGASRPHHRNIDGRHVHGDALRIRPHLREPGLRDGQDTKKPWYDGQAGVGQPTTGRREGIYDDQGAREGVPGNNRTVLHNARGHGRRRARARAATRMGTVWR